MVDLKKISDRCADLFYRRPVSYYSFYLALFSSRHVMAGYLRLEAMVVVFLFIMIWLCVICYEMKIQDLRNNQSIMKSSML